MEISYWKPTWNWFFTLVIGFLCYFLMRTLLELWRKGDGNSITTVHESTGEQTFPHCHEAASETEKVPEQFDIGLENANSKKQHEDETSDLLIDSDQLESQSLVDDVDSPLQVKEYIRYLRENQLQEMSTEEQQEEARVQREQLSNIFKLMQSSQEHFGIGSMEEMEEQMKLYVNMK